MSMADHGPLASFSGFTWCLSRQDLIATFSRKSNFIKFWDLSTHGSSSLPMISEDRLLEDHLDSQKPAMAKKESL